MAFTVEDVGKRATKNLSLMGTLDPLDMLAFDPVRSAHVSQRVLSVAGTALSARLCFEACCTMRFITSAGASAPSYASRYARWKHVESLEHFRKREQDLPWEELFAHTNQAANWLEPDSLKVRKRAHWANDPQFANLFAMAKHLGLENEYHQIYGSGSAFTHASSAASRLYRVGDQVRLVGEPTHVSRFSFLVAGLALRLHRSFLDFFGVAYPSDELSALLERALVAAQAVGAL